MRTTITCLAFKISVSLSPYFPPYDFHSGTYRYFEENNPVVASTSLECSRFPAVRTSEQNSRNRSFLCHLFAESVIRYQQGGVNWKFEIPFSIYAQVTEVVVWGKKTFHLFPRFRHAVCELTHKRRKNRSKAVSKDISKRDISARQ